MGSQLEDILFSFPWMDCDHFLFNCQRGCSGGTPKTYIHACMHTYIIYDSIHTCSYTNIHTCIHTYAYTLQTNIHTHTHTHTHTHISTCTHTHTQTNIHARAPIYTLSLFTREFKFTFLIYKNKLMVQHKNYPHNLVKVYQNVGEQR